jgi:hypothetical protein
LQIKSIEQDEDGNYEFQGVLTQEEINLLVEIGLSVLIGPGPEEEAEEIQMSFDFDGTMQ